MGPYATQQTAMNELFEMAPIVRILIVFGAMLLTHRLGLPLGPALMLGGLGMRCWSSAPWAALPTDILSALLRPDLWLFALNIALILGLGHFMAKKENADAILGLARRLSRRHGRAVSLIMMPAVIGLVPMPGGAVVSAPLVGRTVHEDHWTAEWRTAVNYWFRHLWEYWWPLYPVVMAAMTIFALEPWQFALVLMPFTPLHIAAGYVFLLRPHLNRLSAVPLPEAGATRHPLRVLFPLAMVVICTLALPTFFHNLLPGAAPTTRKLLGMLTGNVLALVWLLREDAWRTVFANVLTPKTRSVVAILIGVMFFESMLTASGLVPAAARNLVDANLPLAFAVALLPLLSGFVTGIGIGFVGASFPLVVGLLQAPGSGLAPYSTLVLAFSMGFVGMMLSPVHLCLILTREYFSAGFWRSYRELLPCSGCIAVTGIAAYWMLHALGL